MISSYRAGRTGDSAAFFGLGFLGWAGRTGGSAAFFWLGTQYSTGPRLERQKTVRWKSDCEMKEGSVSKL